MVWISCGGELRSLRQLRPLPGFGIEFGQGAVGLERVVGQGRPHPLLQRGVVGRSLPAAFGVVHDAGQQLLDLLGFANHPGRFLDARAADQRRVLEFHIPFGLAHLGAEVPGLLPGGQIGIGPGIREAENGFLAGGNGLVQTNGDQCARAGPTTSRRPPCPARPRRDSGHSGRHCPACRGRGPAPGSGVWPTVP